MYHLAKKRCANHNPGESLLGEPPFIVGGFFRKATIFWDSLKTRHTQVSQSHGPNHHLAPRFPNSGRRLLGVFAPEMHAAPEVDLKLAHATRQGSHRENNKMLGSPLFPEHGNGTNRGSPLRTCFSQGLLEFADGMETS